MAATVAMPQKELLRKLMKSGRWNSESEIVRYGIDLVRREVEREQFSPYPEHVLTEAYGQLTKEERRQDERMGRASARPSPGELT
jgi:Arc/MetJ-type ribon-helix-helix transcriptional regulator